MTSHFFIQLVLMLLAGRCLGEVLGRLKAPPVIGEILAGVILGPSLLNWIQIDDSIRLLAEIGIVMLLFEVGLRAEFSRLAKVGLQSLVSAFAGVLAPLILGFLISYYLFDLSLLISLFVGGTLTATSTGITMRVLRDLRKDNTPESQVILGAAILDDVIGIIVLAILFEFSQSGSVQWLNASKVMLFILLFLILAPFAVKIISFVIRRYDNESQIPGLLPSVMVALILFFAWLSHVVGAPELLGGFAAGLALSRRFLASLDKSGTGSTEAFSHRVEHEMSPLIHLFSPLFFVSIGLSLNLYSIPWDSPFVWLFGTIILLAAIVGKLACGFALVKAPRMMQWAVGLLMIPRGELGLVFVDLGRRAGIFDGTLYSAMIIVIALTTLVTPFIVRGFYARTGQLN